jgi:hypothetical protein
MVLLGRCQEWILPVVRHPSNGRHRKRRPIALRMWEMKSFVLAVDIVLFRAGDDVAPIRANVDETLRLQCTRSAAAHLKIVPD